MNYRLLPRHIMLAVRNDQELDKLLKNVTFATSGVVPHIESILLPKKSTSAKKKPVRSAKPASDSD